MHDKFLFAFQGVGAFLFSVVCVAFIFGLRATTENVVLHGEEGFRIALGTSGILFLIMIVVGMALARKP